MKFVVTGSLGNISKPLAEKLIAAGHSVTVVSSKPDKTVIFFITVRLNRFKTIP